MNLNEKVLKRLILEAEKAFERGEVPVCAVIIDQSGNLVSWGRNSRQRKYNVLGHAEIEAILKAEKKVKDWRLDGYSMVVTLEPCSMCSMIIKESRLDHVYFFVHKSDKDFDDFGINKSFIDGHSTEKNYFRKLLTAFFDNKR